VCGSPVSSATSSTPFALVLGIAEFTRFGFYASLLVLLWTAVAGVTLSLRTPERTGIGPGAVAEPARA
jgi:hypothetical protein